MIKIALIYGAIAGSISISVITYGLASGGPSSQTFGYLTMIVALSLIFVGVKSYRDRYQGGVIKFGRAFLLGLAIASVAGGAYVIGWEIYLAFSEYAFIADYTAGVIEAKREAGVTGADLDKIIADMAAMEKNYANPLFRLPMTFLEIFPMGLVIALISAALLCNPKVLPARG